MDSNTKQSQWLQSVLSSMPNAVIATDKSGHIVMMNVCAENMLGVKHKELLDSQLSAVFRIVDGKSRVALKIPSPRAFLRNHDPRVYTHVILITRTNNERWIDGVLSPVKGYRGTVDGSVLVFSDITNIVKNEQDMIKNQKIETIGNMAGSVALDFSNWLSVISGHASSVADNLIPNTRAHDEAMKILDAAEHAGRLTKRLSSIARAGSGSGDAEINEVNLAEVVMNTIDLMSGTFSEQQVSFKTRNLDRAPYVRCNSGQLLDCLMNLFLNSADAMPDGGTISIDFNERVSEKGFIVLRIRDTGTGMPRDVLNRIFEPFFTTKAPGSAIGLGLTVVQSSFQNWGGHIRVRSRIGQGTSFRLFMRKAKRQTRDKKRTVSGGETILVADDRQDVRKQAHAILTEAGYKVHTASGGEECVALYKKHANDIHLSIIDVIMPDKDGKNVLTDILEINPTASIIMTSGFSRDYVRGYMERGAWGFAQKPFETTQLLNTVRRSLDQKSDRAITGLQ